MKIIVVKSPRRNMRKVFEMNSVDDGKTLESFRSVETKSLMSEHVMSRLMSCCCHINTQRLHLISETSREDNFSRVNHPKTT